MAKNILALIAGLVFGLGLVISQMVNPAKVLAFLDITGDWDPSLAFVMGSALVVTTIGFAVLKSQAKPVLAERFQFPASREIDIRLASGAIMFGVGWGLVGLCPGPAITALSVGGLQAAGFLAAMFVGKAAYELAVSTGPLKPATQS